MNKSVGRPVSPEMLKQKNVVVVFATQF